MTRDYSIAKVWKGSVQHEILYLESGSAIHMTPDKDIEITHLQAATKGRDIEWTTLTGPYMSDYEVIDRANALKEQRMYSLSTYNCEDFTRELIGLVRSSPTRDKFIIGGFATLAVICLIAASR